MVWMILEMVLMTVNSNISGDVGSKTVISICDGFDDFEDSSDEG